MSSSGAKLESQISGVSNLASEEGDEKLIYFSAACLKS
jgi:hypothetical protein